MQKTDDKPDVNARLRSVDIVIYALGSLGGSKKNVGLEDIAMKCYEIIPIKFSWTHYDYPDKSLVRHSLNGNMKYGLVETNKNHWTLTAEGVEWLKKNRSKIKSLLGSESPSEFDMTRLERRSFIKHIEEQDIFKMWTEHKSLSNTNEFQLADLLDCLPETSRDNRLSKLHILRSKAALLYEKDNALKHIYIKQFLGECESHFFGDENVAG